MLWLVLASSIATTEYWLPAIVNLLMLPDSPENLGFLSTVFLFPFIIFGFIWSLLCVRIIWCRTHSFVYCKMFYRACATLFLGITATPLIHLAISLGIAFAR